MEQKLPSGKLQVLGLGVEEPNGFMQISEPLSTSRCDLDDHCVTETGRSIGVLHTMERGSIDGLLLQRTRSICERNRIEFGKLSPIQRKFVTHYRCNQCGLLPLYHLNLLHVKRVRCRKCGQLIAFKRKGKYGKLRKEIALEFAQEVKGDVKHA